jgi:hypothetical protein
MGVCDYIIVASTNIVNLGPQHNCIDATSPNKVPGELIPWAQFLRLLL